MKTGSPTQQYPHGHSAPTCAEAIERAKTQAQRANTPYTVYRALCANDQMPAWVILPESDPVPAGWNPVATYDPDGTEYPA